MEFGKLGAIFGRLGGTGAVVSILLSNTTIPDSTVSGSVVGNLSVKGGTGAYTYTLTSNPGVLFAITTNQLKTNATLSAGSYPITIQATGGKPTPVTTAFVITVTATSSQSDGIILF